MNGETKTIWTDSDPTKNASMWAPEIHQIDNIWYMFYSSCNSKLACCDSCRTRVLKGCVGTNPYDCTYSYLAELTPPTGFQGGQRRILRLPSMGLTWRFQARVATTSWARLTLPVSKQFRSPHSTLPRGRLQDGMWSLFLTKLGRRLALRLMKDHM
jgi:hypothetical protein